MGKDIFLFGLTTRVRSFVCLSCIKYPELRTTYSILCQTWAGWRGVCGEEEEVRYFYFSMQIDMNLYME